MECERWAEEAKVPEALASVTSASTVFYTLPDPLNDQGVRRHTLLATQDSQLVEVEEGTHILRSAWLPPGDVTKVVVHHEFDPRQLFVVVLFSVKKIAVLTYSNFKVVYERSTVADISSEDREATGTPKLILTNTSGKEERLTGRRLLSLCDSRGEEEGEEAEEEHHGKREAVAALATRLQGGLRQVKELEGQRRSKERYIQRSLSALQAHLAGHQHNTPTTILMPALTLPDTRSKVNPSEPRQLIQPPPEPPQSPPLSIINIRYKVLHDKWVIGINVLNKGNRVVVHNPQLVLCGSGGRLSYSCRVLKMVRRTPAARSHPSAADSFTSSKVTIESLHPPVLRPGKRACVLATCELPGFLTGPTVTYSGLLTYTTRSLHARDTQAIVPLRGGVEEEGRPGDVVQVSVGQVEVRAAQLEEHQVTFDFNPIPAGVSFSSVALVGSSVTTHVSLTTITSPLTDIIATLHNTLKLVKVNDLRNFYCFYPNHPHPLRHAAFTITHPDPHIAALTLYTRDKNQALLVVHSLLAALPCDTTIQPSSDNTPVHTEVHKLRSKLLSKMSKVAMDIIDSYETRLQDRDKVRKHDESWTVEAGKSGGLRERRLARQEEARRRSAQFEREVEDLKARERQVIISGQEYRAWRNTLRDMQMEMDELYIQFVELRSSL